MTNTATAQPTPYREGIVHRLTIAAMNTPAGQPVTAADHDRYCTTCPR